MINSLTTTENPFNSTDELITWIERRNREVSVQIEKINFKDMKDWKFDSENELKHVSNRFFSIQGIHVKTDFGDIHSWDQPIINQPEIGYLGIITKEINGTLYFLMQAKIEPGNVNYVQVSPTLQATKSNYTRIHQGKKPHYLDYFTNAKSNQIILDQLQSEQGSRFLKKRNRNIIIKVEEDIEVLEDFRWFTLAQIKELMSYDNLVNMDTRTVISGIDFSEYITPSTNLTRLSDFGRSIILSSKIQEGYYSINDHLSWLTNLKSKYELNIAKKPLKSLDQWIVKDDEIVRYDKQYFKVIGVNVSISNREVHSWCQPLVQPMHTGLCAFIIKKIGNMYHFLVQAKLECGNFDVIELAPTAQCLTGNVFTASRKPPFVDYILNTPKEKIVYDSYQSEEGGRFYHEQNRNMIIEADDNFSETIPENYRWMTLNQLYVFLKFNNFLNIQARSLLAGLKYN